MQNILKNHRAVLLAEALVVAYLGIVGFTAHRTGIYLILFPELAALAHDVITRPHGKWAAQPWQIILTPTLAAVLGLFITRHAAYGAVAITAITIVSLFVIKVLRSDISPAISAGVLPLVLAIKSWLYPVTIFADLLVLVGVMLLWRRFGPTFDYSSTNKADRDTLTDAYEAQPHDRFWAITLLAFVFVLGIVAEVTGLRFLLFPPLVVMAYEIFGHPELPGWMAHPVLFPFICFFTASIGLVACLTFHTSFTGVALTMICSIGVLRVFKVHMPPALAVGLLPFVITAPSFRYPVSVGIGTLALVGCFWGRGYYLRLSTRNG